MPAHEYEPDGYEGESRMAVMRQYPEFIWYILEYDMDWERTGCGSVNGIGYPVTVMVKPIGLNQRTVVVMAEQEQLPIEMDTNSTGY